MAATRGGKRSNCIVDMPASVIGYTLPVQAMRGVDAGVYLAPLRLLAMEVADTCNAGGTFCSLVTGPAALTLNVFRTCCQHAGLHITRDRPSTP